MKFGSLLGSQINRVLVLWFCFFSAWFFPGEQGREACNATLLVMEVIWNSLGVTFRQTNEKFKWITARTESSVGFEMSVETILLLHLQLLQHREVFDFPWVSIDLRCLLGGPKASGCGQVNSSTFERESDY